MRMIRFQIIRIIRPLFFIVIVRDTFPSFLHVVGRHLRFSVPYEHAPLVALDPDYTLTRFEVCKVPDMLSDEVLRLMALPVLGGAGFAKYSLLRNPFNPEYAVILYPIVIGILLTFIPYLFALYQSYRLLNYIDGKKAFSNLSVTALKKIKSSAFSISAIYAATLPFVYVVAEIDDAPGLILVAMIPIFAFLVVAVFTAVLQKLLNEAINIKSENDLTV